jgi:hypothetical protein
LQFSLSLLWHLAVDLLKLLLLTQLLLLLTQLLLLQLTQLLLLLTLLPLLLILLLLHTKIFFHMASNR